MESKKAERRRRIAGLVEEELDEQHRIYGSKKIAENRRAKGERGSRCLAAQIMREKGLKSKVVKKKATTNPKHNPPMAENLLKREFHAARLNENGSVTSPMRQRKRAGFMWLGY